MSAIALSLTREEYGIMIDALMRRLRELNHYGYAAQRVAVTIEHIRDMAEPAPQKPALNDMEPAQVEALIAQEVFHAH